MRILLRIVLALVVILILAAATIWLVGPVNIVVSLFGPHHGWDPSLKSPAPDYAQAANWAALPGHPSSADLVPKGVAPAPANPQVDVFFIHPTGYLHGGDWNSPMDANSQTEENTRWMMANQASAFNGCCAVYAPRYREASIFYYFARPAPDVAKKTFDLAYGDVDRAFTYFLEHYSRGRPFIIASHSQGTAHALHLIQARIDGTPLAARMVAAYTIGGGITDRDIAAMKTVHACASATDTHCIIHWATWGDGGGPSGGVSSPARSVGEVDRAEGARRKGHDASDAPAGKLLCINPLSWLRDGSRAPASAHVGAVVPSGRFQLSFWTSDKASGMAFPPLAAPIAHETWAECRKGLLYVADQKGTAFGALDLGGKNYHGLDYPLFAMDIRENAIARVRAYEAGNGAR